MMSGTRRSNNDDERSFFAQVDAFGVKMALFGAIFRQAQKNSHNSFKNRTFLTGVPPPE
jgi:hypothetical protein